MKEPITYEWSYWSVNSVTRKKANNYYDKCVEENIRENLRKRRLYIVIKIPIEWYDANLARLKRKIRRKAQYKL